MYTAHIELDFERQFYSVIEGQYLEVCLLIRGEVLIELIINIHVRSKCKFCLIIIQGEIKLRKLAYS